MVPWMMTKQQRDTTSMGLEMRHETSSLSSVDESFTPLDLPNSSAISTTNSTWDLFWQALAERRQTKCTDGVNKAIKEPNHQWVTILFGQLVALLASSSNAATFTLLNSFSVETQFFQLTGLYILLSLHLIPRKRDDPINNEQMTEEESYRLPGTRLRLRIPWWIYLLMSLFDVLPNFLQLLSFRYTSLTSTTLLGSLTVPSTMIFSRYILAKRFGFYHYLGVCLCLMGGSLTVWLDHHADNDTKEEILQQESSDLHPTFSLQTSSGTLTNAEIGSQALIGDILAVTAAVIYGLGDTVAEYSIKHIDRQEYLGMLGLFGTMQSVFFTIWLEGEKLSKLSLLEPATQLQVAGVLVWYTVSVLGYYLTEVRFLLVADATLLNLSLQAANLWAILFSVVAYRALPPLLFYAALILVASGVFVYEIHGARHHQRCSGTTVPKGDREQGCETVNLAHPEDSPLIQGQMVAGRRIYESIA